MGHLILILMTYLCNLQGIHVLILITCINENGTEIEREKTFLLINGTHVVRVRYMYIVIVEMMHGTLRYSIFDGLITLLKD